MRNQNQSNFCGSKSTLMKGAGSELECMRAGSCSNKKLTASTTLVKPFIFTLPLQLDQNYGDQSSL